MDLDEKIKCIVIEGLNKNKNNTIDYISVTKT